MPRISSGYRRGVIIRNACGIAAKRKFRPDPSPRQTPRPSLRRTYKIPLCEPGRRATQPSPMPAVSDRVLRDVARVAAGRIRSATRRIVNFGRVARSYLALTAGNRGRTALADHVFGELCRRRDEADRVRLPFHRADAERAAVAAIEAMEREILRLANVGQRMDRSSAHGYAYVKTRLGYRGRHVFLTLGRADPAGRRKVLCLQGGGDFNRRNRRPSLDQRSYYRPVPWRFRA